MLADMTIGDIRDEAFSAVLGTGRGGGADDPARDALGPFGAGLREYCFTQLSRKPEVSFSAGERYLVLGQLYGLTLITAATRTMAEAAIALALTPVPVGVIDLDAPRGAGECLHPVNRPAGAVVIADERLALDAITNWAD